MDVSQAPDFTLRQLSYLVAASEAGSIAAASAQLHVAPSTVSEALSVLERTLGVQLTVRRRAHGLTLTSAGVQVVSAARRLLAESVELVVSLRAAEGELVGPITIACYPTLVPTVLPPLLDDFGRANPRVQLQIMELTHDQLVGRIESGEVDVAFVYETLIPGAPRRRRLFASPAHVLLPADHPLAAAPSVRLEDIVDEDLILLDASPSSEHALSLFARRGLTPNIRHRTGSYEAVRTLVGRGLGYGILVQRPRNPRSYEGYRVVMKEISPPVPPVGIEVIWSSTVEPPRRLVELIEFAGSIPWGGES